MPPTSVLSTSLLRRASLGVLLAVALIGCAGSSSKDSKDSKARENTGRTAPGRRPARSVGAALDALLTAEQRGDHARSYALLSPRGLERYPTASSWARRRVRLPAVTGFSVVGSSGKSASAVVRHVPALDPFLGLTPARERQTWTGRKTSNGWLLDPDPTVKLLLPPEAGARDAAQQWARAVQRCDQTVARSLQEVEQLFGDAAAASGLCGSTAEVVVGRVGRLGAGPASADIVAQYSTDALTWARVVEVTAPVAFRAVVVPLGDDWSIIGILSRSSSSNG